MLATVCYSRCHCGKIIASGFLWVISVPGTAQYGELPDSSEAPVQSFHKTWHLSTLYQKAAPASLLIPLGLITLGDNENFDHYDIWGERQETRVARRSSTIERSVYRLRQRYGERSRTDPTASCWRLIKEEDSIRVFIHDLSSYYRCPLPAQRPRVDRPLLAADRCYGYLSLPILRTSVRSE